MATQQEISYVTNALIGYAHKWIATLSPWQQMAIPMDKLPQAAANVAAFCISSDEEFRNTHQPPAIPSAPPAPVAANAVLKRKYRRRK